MCNFKEDRRVDSKSVVVCLKMIESRIRLIEYYLSIGDIENVRKHTSLLKNGVNAASEEYQK